MSIKTRLAFLLGLLLLGFLTTWLVLGKLERIEAAQIAADARASRVQTLNHWIDLHSRSLPQFASEAAQNPEFATGSEPTGEMIRQISAEMAGAGVDIVWLLRAEGVAWLQVDSAIPGNLTPTAPLSPNEFIALTTETPSPRFFAEHDNTLIEVCVRRRVNAPGSPDDWLMVARRWDGTLLRGLARLSESNVSLIGPGENSEPPPGQTGAVVLRPLVDWQGRTVRLLRAEYLDPGLERTLRNDARPAYISIVFGLCVVGALGLALQKWVLRPLALIGQSLASHDSAAIGELQKEPTELGQIARLVEHSFAQSKALRTSEATLRHTLEERARLGRDLHDGVIQSLYAAGMGLAGVRLMLGPGQTEIDARLGQTREILNETIRDVRNFITGLEPEALKQQTFGHAVTTLLATMQAIRPLRSEVEIDDQLAAQLSLAQRVHALQIARESVSNALRHGAADHVRITLRNQNGRVEFEIRDNGRGFDQTAATSNGLGLGNLAERARELGAELEVQSEPGQGTQVKLILPLPLP